MAQRTHQPCAGVRRLAYLSAITLVVATACTTGSQDPENTNASSSEPSRASTGEWGSCPDDYFVKQPEKSFDRDQVDCRTVNVPAVYGSDSGLPDFGLALMRVRATGEAENQPTLFVNPGGPGGSGIEEIQQQKYPQAILDSYNIVGFDPRGVLHSQPTSGDPIRCSDELDFASYWTEATPDNQAQVDEIEKAEDAYMADCQTHNPAWWTLGTDNVVRDLDVMRNKLTGKAPLNFLGSSYGTTIAAEYLRMFPQHNGHIILDSPTDSSAGSDASLVADARSMNQHLLRLVDGYAEAKGLTRTEVIQKLQLIRQWGDDDKLVGFAGLKPAPDGSANRLSTEYLFDSGLVALTYYDTQEVQKTFNNGIDGLLKHKWNGLFEYLGLQMDGYDLDAMWQAYQNQEPYDSHGYTRDNSFEIRQMVNGIDVDQRDLRTHAQDDALEAKMRAAAPLLASLQHDATDFKYYDDHAGNEWSWAAFDDPKIPDPPMRLPPRVNTSGSPVMVIGSRLESTTPYQYAVRTAEDLKSVLITWNGDEHAPLAGFQHSCLNQLFVAYLVNDRLPKSPVTCSE